MSQPTTRQQSSVALVQRSAAHASLAALGVHLRHLDLFGPIRQHVHIAQQTVRYAPADKRYDAFSYPSFAQTSGMVTSKETWSILTKQ